MRKSATRKSVVQSIPRLRETVGLGSVGPNPGGPVTTSITGQLEVYSALQECRDGNEYDKNPIWYQHTDYLLYDLNRKPVRHVFNSVGHYEEKPRPIHLRPGKYLVKAPAKDYMQVIVPVIIQAGRTTKVHLDGNWNVPTDLKSEVVTTTSGYPVGWRTDLAKQ